MLSVFVFVLELFALFRIFQTELTSMQVTV